MSVYNGAKYLNAAIDSILNQTYSDFEFIIINDGSTDNTQNILNSYSDIRIRVINQKNKGLIASLNRGISLASGEYIARQDADDISLPDRIDKQVKVLDSNDSMVLVGSSFYTINDSDDVIGIVKVPRTDTEIRWRMNFNNAFCHTSIMIRSEALKKNNIFYNENDIHAEDYGLFSKLIQHGYGHNIDIPLVKYRIHANQISNIFSENQGNTALLISKRNIERIGVNIEDLNAIERIKLFDSNFPLSISKEDIYICKLYVYLLSKFVNDKYVDIKEFRNIQNISYYHIFNSLNIKNIKEVLVSGLLYDIFKLNKLYIIKYILLGSIKRIFR